ncbi:proton-conducting transporter membrane subunit [Flavihumibacter sp. CACIAM 22H1]|uniref:proton-conducting transporter transmembrane domain-containing protein n=1 Tax=Flavihumibacter sp. CACIAM 22H1 TaxID=1812911 RepID=UPI0007A9110F|nr:proton-conducting transporter membrane subunit [Flavihumibacter sp. CACIAM 22H1]KYP13620.1 MAG: hypothetical protein A1D16_08485 [Flavihumibacter sp. CACIAM 22H1]
MIPFLSRISTFFHVDTLSLVLFSLVVLVALSIGSFSLRYLRGDRRQASFYARLLGLVLSLFLLVSADHLLLLAAAWALSNFLLTRLMLHKQEWEAARQSSLLAGKNFVLGLAFLSLAFFLLYQLSGTSSIQAILQNPVTSKWTSLACLLLVLTAMTQSALWPFHRWLTSSLNSPTPVSAIMHAGLVNGGGFLLARFAPLFFQQAFILNLLFAAGILTALLGTLWKLMQTDIKRMLACSTMGQMGFMLAQCGLGLFPAAIAHLCWHGLFKAYLFLASGSAAREKRLPLSYPPALSRFLLATCFGIVAAVLFAWISGVQVQVADTRWFLVLPALVAGTQFTLPILQDKGRYQLPLAFFAAIVLGACYGASVHFMESLLAPLGISQPQPLNALHGVAALVLIASWLLLLFVRPDSSLGYPNWLLKLYVQMLNAGQPHPGTVTTHRNSYKF